MMLRMWCWVPRSMVVIFLLLVACRREAAPEPTAAELVQQAAARLQETAGFHFAIRVEGVPVYLDADETAAFSRAEGDFVAPDRARANVNVRFAGLVTVVNVITIGDTQWQTNILTRQWEELPPNWGFNPAVLFADDIGLAAILTTDVSALTLTGQETLDDGPEQSLYALTGVVDGEGLYRMSNGLIGPETADLRLWIAPDTFELVRVLLTEPNPAGGAAVWQVDFSDFGQVVEINPPQ